MRKVLWPESQEAPQPVVDGREAVFMGEELVFAAHLLEIVVGDCRIAMSFGDGLGIEQSGLPHEQGLNLEEVVAVMGHHRERHGECPLLHGFAVDAEAIVTRHGDEVSALPRPVAVLSAPAYVLGLALQPLGFESAHP